MFQQPSFFKEINFAGTPRFIGDLQALMRQYKVVHLRNVPEGIDYKEFYTSLVGHMGEMVDVDEDVTTGNRAPERWTDIRYDKGKAFTFRHSNTRQPLHTDTAYTNYRLDVNFFFCLEKAEIGGATTFIDGDKLVRILHQYEPDLFEKARNTEVSFGKGTEQKRTRIISIDDQQVSLNWNYFRVAIENTEDVKKLCSDFHNFLENKIVAGGLLTPVHLAVGECVFFHDKAVLHGRNSFYGNRNLIKGGFLFHS